MLTQRIIDTLDEMAGPAREWLGGGSRPTDNGRNERLGMRYFFWLACFDAITGIATCCFCGDEIDAATDSWDLCHIVSRGKKGKGYVAWNIAAGHSTCNKADRDMHLDIIPLSRIVRPDLIPSVFPAASERVRLANKAIATGWTGHPTVKIDWREERDRREGRERLRAAHAARVLSRV